MPKDADKAALERESSERRNREATQSCYDYRAEWMKQGLVIGRAKPYTS